MTAEEYWDIIRRVKAEADEIALQINALEIRRSDLAHRLEAAYDNLTAVLDHPPPTIPL